ncbi:MAG TPA: T9SS type A sorting domain-containing protein [candidate division Zixibacteria bacterium]|nr:T9SS type A sorting domain-containing protein [candidate division Zixibacteria bacterium]
MIKYFQVSFRTLAFFTKIILISSIFSTIFAQEQNIDHFSNKYDNKASLSNDPQLEVTRSGLWSAMMDFIVEGDFAYCAMINGIMILDISDLENPKWYSQCFLNDITWQVSKGGNFLYATTRESGLKVIDVSDKRNPRLIKTLTFDSNPQGVLADGTIAFVATLTSLNVVDMSDPVHPDIIGNLAVPGFLYYDQPRLKRSRDYLYVASGDLWIFDLSNYESPSLISRLEVPLNSVDLELDDTLLYLLEQSSLVPSFASSLSIINIKDPDSPLVLIRHVMEEEFSRFEIDSAHVYVSASESGILILDISNPDSIITAGCFPGAGISGNIICQNGKVLVANNVAILPDDLYPHNYCSHLVPSVTTAIDNSGDFQIVDFSNPQEPILVGVFRNPGLSNLITSSENYLYVASSNGFLNIVDANNSGEFSVLSSLQLGEVADMAALENKLICIGSTGLNVISTSNASEPELVGNLSLPPFPFGVAAAGDLAVVCAGSYGIGLVDISCPDSLELLSTLSTPDFAIDALIDGNYAYVADRYSGLQVVDISNPTSPVIVSSFPGPGLSDWIIYLEQKNHILYAAGGGYINILDVANPMYPTRVGTYPAIHEIRSLEIIDNFLAIAATDGVELVNISNPSNLIRMDYLETPGFAMSVTHVSNRLQVADIFGLIEMGFSISTEIGEEEAEVPISFVLYQNYPNPFNPSTTIEYSLTKASKVQIIVLNALGQQIVTLMDKKMPAGYHQVVWKGIDSNGKILANGVYFYRLTTEDATQTKKMLLLK